MNKVGNGVVHEAHSRDEGEDKEKLEDKDKDEPGNETEAFNHEKKKELQKTDSQGWTLLHRACLVGNKQEVLQLLPQLKQCGILREELFRQDMSKRTPLCLAQADQKKHFDSRTNARVEESDETYEARAETATAMLDWLKDNASDAIWKDVLESVDNEDGRTCLQRVCDKGNKDEVLQLLTDLQQCGILETELLRRDKKNNTALGLAWAEKRRKWDQRNNGGKGGWDIETEESYQARIDTTKAILTWVRDNAPELLQKVLSENVDSEGRSVLHRACNLGKKEEVLRLLSQMQECGIIEEELFRRDKSGKTALCLAQAELREEWNLWESRTDSESEESYKARADTAIAFLEWLQNECSDDENRLMIKVLQDLDPLGRSPLHRACYAGDTLAVILFLNEIKKCGLLREELLRRDSSGKTPLCLVQAEQRGEDVQGCWMVVESLSSYNKRQSTSHTMISWIKNNASADLKKELFQSIGRTAFSRACTSFIKETALMLLSELKPCDILKDELCKVDAWGRTLLHHACDSGHKDAALAILSALQKYKMLEVELLRFDPFGRTALCLAQAERKQTEEFEYNEGIDYFDSIWVDEPDESYCNRQETAKAMIEWIEKNAYAHEVDLDEIKARSQPLSKDKMLEFIKACGGGHNAGIYTMSGDIKRVQQMLNAVNPAQLPQLLSFDDDRGRSALDYCLKNKDKSCAVTIAEHILNTSPDSNVISKLFPYISMLLGQNETVTAVLTSLEGSSTSKINRTLFSKDIHGLNLLEYAIAGGHAVAILLITLLALGDKETYVKMKDLKILAHMRKESDRNPFNEVSFESWQFVLNHLLKRIQTAEGDIDELEKAIDHLKKKEKGVWYKIRRHEASLKKKGEDLEKYASSLKYLPLIAAEKNKFGESLYDYDELNSLHTQVLDKCKVYDLDCEKNSSEMFPSFYFHQEENVPYSKAAPIHPLTVIGEAGNLAIIKHPYICTQVQICWTYFGRYIFYLNLGLYILFMLLLMIFFATHQVNSNTEGLEFPSRSPVLSEFSRYGAIILAICGLIFEGVQIKTKMHHYFNIYTQAENYIDLLLFVCTPVVLIMPLIVDYNEHIHWFGCVLITIAGIRAAWMLTHVNVLGIGHGFRMLFSVVLKVARFSPILLFFIGVFSVVFHNLLQNQEPFSHIGFSIMKIMAMSIGELEFKDSFFDETNVHTFEIVAFIMLVVFLAIMTISMMNLLIGIAVGDVGDLYKQGEQADFGSKVDLILQYSYMVLAISKKIQDMPLWEIYKWGKWQDHSDIEKKLPRDRTENEKKTLEAGKVNNNSIKDKFQEYMTSIEREHNQYKPSPDIISAVEEKVEKTLKRDVIVNMQNEMDDVKKQIQKLNDIVAKQHEEIKQLIANINPAK